MLIVGHNTVRTSGNGFLRQILFLTFVDEGK